MTEQTNEPTPDLLPEPEEAQDQAPLPSYHYRIIRFPIQLLADLFNWMTRPKTHVMTLECDELPEGARIIAVHNMVDEMCLYAIVEHESFSPIAAGARIPRLNDHMTRFRAESIEGLVAKKSPWPDVSFTE